MRRIVACAIVLAVAAASGCQKPVPVDCTRRESLAGAGLVAQLHNQTAAQLTVHVTARDVSGAEVKSGPFHLPPNGSTEIGWLEGWAFAPGHQITVAHPDHAPRTWTFR